MRYENEPCCSCEQLLQPETDDIVVCPDCGAPVHRHCWMQTGACPYADRHEEGYLWEPTVVSQEAEEADGEATAGDTPGIICPSCGENCPPGAVQCEACGTDFEEFSNAMRVRFDQEQLRREQYMQQNFPTYHVNGRDMSMGDDLGGQPVEEIALQLRGSNRTVTRYLKRFEKNARVGWNWAAFFLGPYWFFFRKLYKPALLFAGLLMAMTLGFAPVSNQLNDIVYSESVLESESYSEMSEHLSENIESQALRDCLWKYRWQIGAYSAAQILVHVAMGLLADPILRRKLWRNIEYVNENQISTGSGGRFARHQLLIRLGGYSLFAPLLYFWSLYFLPGVIIDLITWITG